MPEKQPGRAVRPEGNERAGAGGQGVGNVGGRVPSPTGRVALDLSWAPREVWGWSVTWVLCRLPASIVPQTASPENAIRPGAPS